MGGRKPRQVRKEATVAVQLVCRGSPGAWQFVDAPAHSMYQVIARKYRPQTFSELVEPGARQDHPGERHRAEPHRPRLHLLRPARHRQDHRGAHPGALPELRRRAHRRRRAASARAAWRSPPAARVDVIEIDAASNRGINEMRELRENVRYRPARDRYKVFIVDEAHQITNEAFNALLKTLEEPPRVGGLRALHHRGAQDPGHHRLALPALQLPLGRFRGPGRAHGSGSAARKASRPTPKRWPCWRRRAKAACAIRSRRSTRRSPAAATKLEGAGGARAARARSRSTSLEQGHRSAGGERLPAAMLEMVDELERNGQQPAALLPRAGALLPQPAGGAGSPARTRG